MHTLVVGGAGYIGSHVAKKLHKSGYKPVVLDNLSTGHRAAVKYGEFYEGNYADISFVENILKKHSIKTVLHFGAKALVPESIENPLLYYQANVGGTLNLLTAMKNCGVNHFVFSSTCATFGEPAEVPIHEGVKQSPVNPYGLSKLLVEQILKDLHQKAGVRSAILRYFNAAGADPEGELGEDHRPETHLVPRILQVAKGSAEKLVVYGKDYPTSDGSCVRDYVHVSDLADAHVQAMELIWKTDSSFDFNLGSEKGSSVLQVLETAMKVVEHPIPYEFGSRRPGDPATLIADSSKAEKLLNWKRKYNLEDIVSTAWKWMKENPNGYRDREI